MWAEQSQIRCLQSEKIIHTDESVFDDERPKRPLIVSLVFYSLDPLAYLSMPSSGVIISLIPRPGVESILTLVSLDVGSVDTGTVNVP